MDILEKYNQELHAVRMFAKENGLHVYGINKLAKWIKQHKYDYYREQGTQLENVVNSYYQVINQLLPAIDNKINYAKNHLSQVQAINLNWPFIEYDTKLY